jgi:hypothetical protein
VRIYVDGLYYCEVVSQKIYMFCVAGAKKKLFMRHFLIFFTQDTKMSVFRETCHAHIECKDVRAKFLFGIF